MRYEPITNAERKGYDLDTIKGDALLSACPFCAGEAFVVKNYHTGADGEPRQNYFAQCRKCLTKTELYETVIRCVEIWNARPTDTTGDLLKRREKILSLVVNDAREPVGNSDLFNDFDDTIHHKESIS